MGKFDADIGGSEVSQDSPEIEVSLKDDGETVLAVDRHGHEITVPRYGPVRTSARGDRFRHKIVVDECAHDGKTEATKVKRHDYGTSYCPLCDASRGVDGLWRTLEDLPEGSGR